MVKNDTVEIFYACDEGFMKYLAVSLSSLIRHRDEKREYNVHILCTSVGEDMAAILREMCPVGVNISFEKVCEGFSALEGRLPIRDYYSKTTYFRFLIPDCFPSVKKAIYIDADTVVREDISRLYDTELSDFAVGACHEQVMIQTDVFGRYTEEVLGIDRMAFFNAGVMLINCEQWRRLKILERFTRLVGEYEFKVTQDEDYLNVLLKDRVLFLDGRWNAELAMRLDFPIEEAYILHYIMTAKPWHYGNCVGADFFYEEASRTAVYGDIIDTLSLYSDQMKARDLLCEEKLKALAESEIKREDGYLKGLMAKRSPDRLAIEEKIRQYESQGRFAEDVESDPPTLPLKPGEVDFLRKKFSSRIKQAYATMLAGSFLRKILKNGILRIRDIRGSESFASLRGGAVITCNHFNALDSFAMHLAYKSSGHKRRKMYRVIREGNYTSFGGFYGKLMRNFYTLPLSSNHKVLKEFNDAASAVLKSGSFLLVYPEQSMWWNYRKPKPTQIGAFFIAAKNAVPILPIFITMRDSETVGEDGYPIQEYTIHISNPIYPKSGYTYRENAEYMRQENDRVWREIYEKEYGIPLTYTTEQNLQCAIGE